MKNPIVNFVICLIIGFGAGYLGFEVIGNSDSKGAESIATNDETTTNNEKENETATNSNTTPESTASAGDGGILEAKGCIACHAVSGLGLDGGATGPDLSQAYNNVEGKHGKPLDEFLKEPTSAVMSTVISGNPLTDDEIAQIIEALEKAAQ